MTLTRTLLACFLLSTAPVLADGHAETSSLELQDSQLVSQTTSDLNANLQAAAEANPNLEWHEGEEGEADSMVMLSDVLFDFGDATLSPDAIDVLSSIAKELDGVDGLEIVGHTDSLGSDDNNLELAEARALAVKIWLVANSAVHPDALQAVGMGEVEPIAANALENGADNPEGRALNRRVEFHFPNAPVEAPVEAAQLAPEVQADQAS